MLLRAFSTLLILEVVTGIMVTKWRSLNNIRNLLKSTLYSGIPVILNFALCAFIKIQLEATAETIGSVINQHGRKCRYSLRPSSLSNEVQVAWNGPSEMSKATTNILEESIDQYFKNIKTSVQFYVSYQLKLMSTTVKNYFSLPSRIENM